MDHTVHKPVEQRAREAVLRAIGISPATDIALRMGSTPGWDSMGHMTVVLELEKEFQTIFPSYCLPELVDIPSITKAVTRSTKVNK